MLPPQAYHYQRKVLKELTEDRSRVILTRDKGSHGSDVKKRITYKKSLEPIRTITDLQNHCKRSLYQAKEQTNLLKRHQTTEGCIPDQTYKQMYPTGA